MVDNERAHDSLLPGISQAPDALQVIDIMQGAARAPRDPDVDLAQVLARLRDADEAALRAALATLVLDAHSD